jgi:hypothetical protein
MRVAGREMKKILLLAALASVCGQAAAQAPLAIFGVPFGGKTGSMPKLCPMSAIGRDDNKTMCWLDKPHIYAPTGGRSGMILMPHQKTFPSWAAFAIFDAEISKHGVLDVLNVKVTNGKARAEIEDSISSRFGPATTPANARYHYTTTKWDRPEISIEIICNKDDYCKVTFMSPAARSERAREMADRRSNEAKRSVSP